MDSFKLLIETHSKANKFEKEIRKTRGKLIQAYKNKDFNELYTLHTSYTGFAAQLNKETATFDTLLNDLDIFYFINNHYNNANQYSELIDNINDSCSSISVSEEQQEITTFYSGNNNNSPVVTDKDTSIISFETQSKQAETELDLYNNSFPVNDNYVLGSQMTMEHVQRNENEPESIVVNNTNINDIDNYNNYNIYNNSVIWSSENEPESVMVNNTYINGDIVDNYNNYNNSVIWSSENYQPSKISEIRSGYEYGGKDVFTCYRNKCQPIYSSTLLFCNETCNENENEPESVVVNNHNNNIDNTNDNNSVITFKSY